MYKEQIIFQGISVDVHGDGKQSFMDATVAYKQAALNTMDYLMGLGYSREQACELDRGADDRQGGG